MKAVDVKALIGFVALIAGGVTLLVLGHETAGSALLGAALGQLGPSPVKVGK